MTKSAGTTTDSGREPWSARLGVALVAAVSILWFVVLGFYALVGSAALTISNDRSIAPAVAAGATAWIAVIGVITFLKARQSGPRGALLLSLAALFSGLSGLSWVAVAGGSAIGWPAALAATGSAAAFLVAGFGSRH